MTDASSGTESSGSWNEDGQLFLVAGIVTAVVAWVFLPLAGLVSVYCGIGLWTEYDRTLVGGTIAVVGGFGVVVWIAVLVSVSL